MAEQFIIDTDALSLYFGKDAEAVRVFEKLKIRQLFSTVVTADEIIAGWQNSLRRAKTLEQQENAWRRYTISLNLMSSVTWLPFTQSAIERYEALKKDKTVRAVGNNDLRIAAIALENGATVVSRNQGDFRRVPKLDVAAWSGAATGA